MDVSSKLYQLNFPVIFLRNLHIKLKFAITSLTWTRGTITSRGMINENVPPPEKENNIKQEIKLYLQITQ